MESLLSFTELDTGKVAVALRCISDDLESLDRERMTNAMVRLGALVEMHSFFRVLYTKWFYLRSVGFKNATAAVSEALNELRMLPEELPLYQKQIQRFFALILDIDKAGRGSSQQVIRYYHFDQPDQPSDPELFRSVCSPRALSRWMAILRAGAVREHRGGYDQLFFADLRGAQHHCTPLQKLRAVLRPDRPRQRRVLRPHTTRRSVQLPCDGCIPAVDAEAGG